MKLTAPFIQLPVSFDDAALAEEISRIEQSEWRAHPDGIPGNSALTLITKDGNPESDELSGEMRPTPSLSRLPYLMQVLNTLGATWGRTRLMRLSGQAEVSPHVDINYYWRERMRVHIPITTTPSVRFHCGDSDIHMAQGECWIFDTWRLHRVMNAGNEERIHLVADTVGGERFWELADAGKLHGQDKPDWCAKFIGPNVASTNIRLDYETVNSPIVMTPWEVRSHISFLVGEATPSPSLVSVRELLVTFARRWQALWACYGESKEGWVRYRRLIDATRKELAPHRPSEIMLGNEVSLARALASHVFEMAVSDRSSGNDAARLDRHGAMPVAITPEPASTSILAAGTPDLVDASAFDRPVFIISPPRSGSTLLFETLAGAPDIYTIGDESHRMIEQVKGLSPRDRGFDSNVLEAADASSDVVNELRGHFRVALRDRDGHAPPLGAVRMLEKTPKNALRIPFLNEVFPNGRYVFLYRDARETIASMIDAWKSGRFRTYPGLPGWPQLPWSLVLVPRWRELSTKPLHEVVAAQWETTMNSLLDGLAVVPRENWCAMDYAELLEHPQAQMEALCKQLGLSWDRALGGQLPLSRYTLTQPGADKWRKYAAVIEPMLPRLAPTIERARAALAEGMVRS